MLALIFIKMKNITYSLLTRILNFLYIYTRIDYYQYTLSTWEPCSFWGCRVTLFYTIVIETRSLSFCFNRSNIINFHFQCLLCLDIIATHKCKYNIILIDINRWLAIRHCINKRLLMKNVINFLNPNNIHVL